MAIPSGKEKIFSHFMKSPNFELTHNADSTYPEVAPHYHEFFEIVFFISGNIHFIVSDQSLKLQNGDLLIIPPNTLHNPTFENFDVTYERYILWLSPQIMDEFKKQDPNFAYFYEGGAHLKRYLLRRTRNDFLILNECFIRLEECFNQKQILWHAVAKAIITFILAEYNRALLTSNKSAEIKSSHQPISNILNYIHSNLDKDLSLEKVAAHFFMSKFSLSHLFKKILGVSFYQYLLKQRLMVGKELILNGLSAQDAAIQCGFKDYSNFYRAFLKEYEIKPSVLKKLNLKVISNYGQNITEQKILS